MAFHDDLSRHAEAVKSRIPHIKGEEATKHALVVPLLQVLGYDVFDPREVQPEYIADFAKKKSSGQLEKIDYAVWLDSKPVIFVECKAIDAKLDDHDGQLARYFNATPSVRVAILTNGVRLKVFTDLQQPNIMDPTPWLDVDLLSAKPAEIEALKRFRKADFTAEQVTALAEEMVYFNAMHTFLAAQLREPSEAFVRFVAAEIPATGRLTQKVVERLAPILRKAIQSAILDNVARSFGQPASEAEGPAVEEAKKFPAPVPPVSAGVTASVDGAPDAGGRAGVVTTQDELDCWNLISTWVREVRPDAAISYRDSKSYFTIHQNNLRKWCVRLNVSKTPYWVAFRHVPGEDVRRLAPGVEIIEAAGLGDSRVALKSVGDLSKLRATVIAAYEKEAARTGDDGLVPSDDQIA